MAEKIDETIFDHNITEKETKFLGFDYADEGIYRKLRSPDSKLADLTKLYVHRGDWSKAKEYFKQISDKDYKFSILQILIGDVFYSEEELERARKLSEFFEDAL